MLIFFFLFSTSMTAYADTIESGGEISVKLKANELKFNQETGIASAIGSVEASFEDIVLKADAIYLNVDTSIATAEGSVDLIRESYEATGSSMTFDFKNDTASIKDFCSVVTDPGIKGNVYLKAKEAIDWRDQKTGIDGSSTTCDQQDDPHYFVMAKKFIYKPDDKLIAQSATAYIRGVPMMWLPYYVYDLKNRRTSLLMPIFGSNDVEGNFMKNELQYYIDDGAWGSVYLDLMSKKGIGYGFDHNYTLNSKNSGDLYLYHVYESDTGISDWVGKLKHQLLIDENKKLGLEYNYSNIYLVPSGRLDKTDTKLDYNYSGSNESFDAGIDVASNRQAQMYERSLKMDDTFRGARSSYSYNSKGSIGSTGWENIFQTLTHSQKLLSDNINFNGNVNFYRTVTGEGYPFDERLEPSYDLTYADKIMTLKFAENFYIDADRNAFLGDVNDEYVEKLPEASLTLNSLRLASFEVKPTVAYGRYNEAKFINGLNYTRHFTTNRYMTGLSVKRNFPLGFGTTFELSAGVEQYNYDTQDQRYLQTENFALRTELGGFYRNSLVQDRGISEGNSPFFFDNQGNTYNTLKDTMVFYKGRKMKFTIDGGYNFLTDKYLDLMYNFDAAPSDSLHFNISSGYDINEKSCKDLLTVLTIVPLLGLSADISHAYDINVGETKSASDLVKWEIGDTWQNKWKFSIGHTYDYIGKTMVMQELSITKDLHCWEVTYSYSEFRKEFTITFALKAFPEMPLGFASGNRGFFLQGMDQSGQGAVRY